MKKASASFLVLFFAILMTSFQTFAQVYRDSNVITERVNQSIRMYERLRLADLLRLSYEQQRNIEIRSLSVMASSLQGQAQLELSQNGLPLASETVRRQLKEVKFILTRSVSADGLELSSNQEIMLESITAEVSMRGMPGPGPGPGPRPDPREQQVLPNSLLTLQVNQDIRGMGEIHLKQLVKQQMGLSLEGAEIDRVVVEGMPSGYGRAASVQVELNGRPVGMEKYLSAAQRRTPIQVQSMEEVRTLKLLVRGDARIHTVLIRVGQVRPQQHELPRIQRIQVNQEISRRLPLELSRLLPYENRLIRSISIEARTGGRQSAATLSLMSRMGEFLGTTYVSQMPSRQIIQLYRPMTASEIRIEADSQVMIESLEIEFEQNIRY